MLKRMLFSFEISELQVGVAAVPLLGLTQRQRRVHDMARRVRQEP